MMATSFVIGILSTLIAYIIGIPIGVLMARNKDKLFDKIAMIYIIIMFSVPSLAYIYFFKFLGTKLFDLPVNYKYGEVLTYILPVLSLSLSSIASLMMWTRRYIIDQGNSDYVKFARAKGLSESQIFFKHILRNAIVPIAHGIPGSLVGAVAGALITEQIYVVPGTGKLMVSAIQNYDNWVAIGLIFFYTCLGIFSLIAGDVIITLVDPRISFVDTGGRK
jgi:oligopeptide transport system permease protein